MPDRELAQGVAETRWSHPHRLVLEMPLGIVGECSAVWPDPLGHCVAGGQPGRGRRVLQETSGGCPKERLELRWQGRIVAAMSRAEVGALDVGEIHGAVEEFAQAVPLLRRQHREKVGW